MKSLFVLLKDKYLNDKLDFRAQIFNLLAMTGMILGVISAMSCVFTNAGWPNASVNLLTSLLSFALLIYSSRTGRYKICYLITVVAVFVIAFPILFFTAGGYYSGMPAFFVFAIVFTVFMLEGKRRYVMSALEVIIYIAVCLIAFIFPETVSCFETERDTLTDIAFGFTMASAALSITVIHHVRIYDRKQRELAEANAALEQADQMKTEFLGNISHELKTPLTVISGYAQTARQLLTQDNRQNPAAEKMKLISSEAERMALLVGQILDITRIEERRMVMEIEPCYPEEIIHASVGTYYPILNKNHNRLDIFAADNLPMIWADPARISQVIVNLISNAVRFTSNGRITVSAESKGAFVQISVTDTGAGINEARLPFIFDRYNNNQKTGGGQNTGTGLGLYICKYIVEAHGGEISVWSREGEGTTVYFTVPAAM